MSYSLVKIISDLTDYFKYSSEDNPTTMQKFIELCKNQFTVLHGLSKLQWQPETDMELDQIVWSPNMAANLVAKVTAIGTTGTAEPEWPTEMGGTCSDGGVIYTMQYAIVPYFTETSIKDLISSNLAEWTKSICAQVMYPVGTVLTFTNDTDPNTQWRGMTWVKFAEGRTLVGAGNYSDSSGSYTYTNGGTGGEAKHQITVNEMPSHGHNAAVSTSGNHSHQYYGHSGNPNAASSYSGTASWDVLRNTSTNGAHSHTVTIGQTGGNVAHENRQPYFVVTFWRRTA